MIRIYRDIMLAARSHVSESAGLEDILSEFADTPVLDNTSLCVTYRTHHTSHVAKIVT